MKELNDKYIQKILEEGVQQTENNLQNINKDDFEVYQQLFLALKKEPSEGLSYNFSAKIGAKLQARQKVRNSYKFHLSMAFIVVIGFISSYVAMMMIDKEYATTFIPSLFKYKWVFIFSLVALFMIQYFDQRLVKTRSLNNLHNE